MNGGDDDMRRRLARELDNPFAQIGLDRIQPCRFERGVEMNLFGCHAFRFDDARRLTFAQ